MKNFHDKTRKLVLLLQLLITSNTIFSQGPNALKRYTDRQNFVVDSNKYKILTERGINYFIADKMITFLANDGDISLKKSYALVSTEDESFSFGYNFKNKTDSGQRLKFIFAPGIKADLADGLGSFYSNGKYNNNISATLKVTLFGKSSLFFDDSKQITQNNLLAPKPKKVPEIDQKGQMSLERQILAKQLYNKYEEERRMFEGGFDSTMNKAKTDAIKDEFYKDQIKKYKAEFHEKEAEILKEKGYYNAVFSYWHSVGLTIPFSESTYYVVDKASDFIGEKRNYNINGFYQLNLAWDSKKYGRFFISGGLTLKNNTTIHTKQMEEIDKQELKTIQSTDSTVIYQSSADKAYLGTFQSFFSSALNFQFIYYFPKLQNIGFRLSYEKYLNDYHPLNYTFGIPIKLVGKEDDKFVNIEPQVKLLDAYNTLGGSSKIGDRLVIGIKLGLPFSSIIY